MPGLTEMMGRLKQRRASKEGLLLAQGGPAAPAVAPIAALAAAPAAARRVAELSPLAEVATLPPPSTEPGTEPGTVPGTVPAPLQCIAVDCDSPPPRTPSAVRLQSARAANGTWRHVLQAARTLLQSEQIVLSQHAPPCLWLGPTLGVGANCEVKSAMMV